MIGALLGWMLGLAVAQTPPSTELLRQQQEVEQAAEAVATARARGARRSEVAELMATYRAAATALEALQAPLATDWEQTRRERLEAVVDLGEALAAGKTDRRAAALLTDWLGDPSQRLVVLREAIVSREQLPTEVRDAILRDVTEQATALSALLAYEAADARRRADAATLRASSLRRSGPGQGVGIAAELEAQQLEAAALADLERSTALSTLRQDALGLRAAAVAPPETP